MLSPIMKAKTNEVITFGVLQAINATNNAINTSEEVETNGAKTLSYYGLPGYGGVYIDGYNGSSWSQIYGKSGDNVNVTKGILDISSYTKVRCRAKKGSDDGGYNKRGIWIVCTINGISVV